MPFSVISFTPFCYHLAMLHGVKSSLPAYARLTSAILFLFSLLVSLHTFMYVVFNSALLCISLSIRQPGNDPAQETHYTRLQ